MKGFVFVDDPDAFGDAAALVVRVPSGIRSKRKLLAIYADKLAFPRYFGWNWDALCDCLTDAAARSRRPIVVVHADLPFGAASELRRTYLELLRDSCSREDLDNVLRAVFSASDEAAVNAATSGPR